MKITKRQLRRIIKEEKAKLLRETAHSAEKVPLALVTTTRPVTAGEKIHYVLNDIVDDALNQLSPDDMLELAGDLRGLADDVEDSIPEDEASSRPPSQSAVDTYPSRTDGIPRERR